MLRVERGEILRESFAQPLLVIIAPADRLAPPLVRQLVGEEEIVVALERRRIVAARSDSTSGSGWLSAAK
jgi:hypothetical protein